MGLTPWGLGIFTKKKLLEALLGVHPPKFNSLPLKNGAWETTFLFWEGRFSGSMLVLGRVNVFGPIVGSYKEGKWDPEHFSKNLGDMFAWPDGLDVCV